MGCCLSSDTRSGTRQSVPRSPPQVEEETVKEVLSETRIVPKVEDGVKRSSPPPWKVDFRSIGDGGYNPLRRVNQERKVVAGKENEEIVSESSEMFSYSESLSNTTAPEKRGAEEKGVVEQRRPSPRNQRGPTPPRGRGERVYSRKLAASSPERRAPLPPTVPPRAGRGRAVTPKKRNVAEERGARRDPRDGSVRRSKTPERRSDAVGRRNTTDIKSNSAVLGDEESLENPVVSLECFIFL